MLCKLEYKICNAGVLVRVLSVSRKSCAPGWHLFQTMRHELAPAQIPVSQPASVLLSDHSLIKTGNSAGTVYAPICASNCAMNTATMSLVPIRL